MSAPPCGWRDFWKTPMSFEERSKWLRIAQPDDDEYSDIYREWQADERVRKWEKEIYGI